MAAILVATWVRIDYYSYYCQSEEAKHLAVVPVMADLIMAC
jgi:hypothetical protein